MDISLNIRTAASPLKKTAKIKDSPRNVSNRILSREDDLSGGFSFSFTRKANVKAIVARKRIKTPQDAVSVNNNEKIAYSARSKVVKAHGWQMTEPDFASEKMLHDDNNTLMLNITSDRNATLSVEKTKKFTKDERMKSRKQERFGPSTGKVLSKGEIDSGIKKFSKTTNPIRKRNFPKNSDLFHNNPEAKIIGQRLVKPRTEKIFTGASVSSIGLHAHTVKNLKDLLNITELTTVQKESIPKALEGRDLLIRSQTGSGKTLAYALPIVEKLQEIRPKLTRICGIQAVIVVPTRELAIQVYELFLKLLKPFTWIVPGFLTGGESRKSEKARLRKGINILVGTPGRLCDHLLHTESFRLDKVKWLVLDEADRLLEMGYERDVRKIVEGITEHKLGKSDEKKKNPFKRDNQNGEESERNPFRRDNETESTDKLSTVTDLQRMLVSATLTSAVQKLAGLALKDPLFIDASDADDSQIVKGGAGYEAAVAEAVGDEKLIIPATVDLSYILVPPKLRLVTLSGLLAKECTKKPTKALVFLSTMEMVNFHHDLMVESLTQRILDEEDEEKSDSECDESPLLLGVRLFKLHGSLTQQERSGIYKAFRDAKSGVLLATDVCGRGIDIPQVDLVVQYSPPQKISDFVHRVGRTARAGRSGKAILFLGPTDTEFVRVLEDKRIRISQGSMENYLQVLNEADDSAHNIQEAASNLQHKFEMLLSEDKEMHDKACKAFVSWVRFYSTFPKELKSIFNAKGTHMGHYAKSFALRDPPTSFVRQHTTPKSVPPTNRLTYTERDPDKVKARKQSQKRSHSSAAENAQPANKLHKFLPKSISLSTSEFGSGMNTAKTRKLR